MDSLFYFAKLPFKKSGDYRYNPAFQIPAITGIYALISVATVQEGQTFRSALFGLILFDDQTNELLAHGCCGNPVGYGIELGINHACALD